MKILETQILMETMVIIIIIITIIEILETYTIVGSTSGRVHQALFNTEERVYEMVKLEVQIGTL